MLALRSCRQQTPSCRRQLAVPQRRCTVEAVATQQVCYSTVLAWVACNSLDKDSRSQMTVCAAWARLSDVCKVWRAADEQHCSTPAPSLSYTASSQMQTRQPSSGTWTSSASPTRGWRRKWRA